MLSEQDPFLEKRMLQVIGFFRGSYEKALPTKRQTDIINTNLQLQRRPQP